MERTAGIGSADNWLADYEHTVAVESARHATPPRTRTLSEIVDGVSCQKVQFKTVGGSPWTVLYELVEDESGNVVLLRVVRVRHGRSNPR